MASDGVEDGDGSEDGDGYEDCEGVEEGDGAVSGDGGDGVSTAVAMDYCMKVEQKRNLLEADRVEDSGGGDVASLGMLVRWHVTEPDPAAMLETVASWRV